MGLFKKAQKQKKHPIIGFKIHVKDSKFICSCGKTKVFGIQCINPETGKCDLTTV